MHHIDHIVEALARRTQNVFDTAKRHQYLIQRLERLYGALELARLFGSARLAHRIETLIDTTRRDIDND